MAVLLPEFFADGAASGPGGMGPPQFIQWGVAPGTPVFGDPATLPADGAVAAAVAGSVSSLIPAVLHRGVAGTQGVTGTTI